MNVTLPDGTTIDGVPEGTTKQQLAQKLKANGRDIPADWLETKPRKSSLEQLEELEPSTVPKKANRPEVIETPELGEAFEKIGDALAENKITGAVIPEIAAGTTLARRAPKALAAAEEGIERVVAGGQKSLSSLLTKAPEKELVGVGASATTGAAQREAEAAALDVPIKYTKGQKERSFEQQQWERETAKDSKTGEPIRKRFADQNQQILKNFDSWVDKLGATSPDLRSTGRIVDEALVKRVTGAKTDIRMAYNKAKQEGAMNDLVGTTDLVDYLSTKGPESINAPILSSVRDKLVQLGGAKKIGDSLVPGSISVNDMEEVRKMINRLTEPGTPNAVYAGKLKGLIDKTTENVGGPAYRTARKLRQEFAAEFENHAVVDKLLRTKPGTTDRSVAYENVFSHSILNGSTDDVSTIRQTLLKGGAEGRKAWVELQGSMINYIRDAAFKNVARDINGNPIPSPAGLNNAVMDLDRDGKLDVVLGKIDAQKVRDLNKVVIDAYTAPPGSVNASNTSSALINALKKLSDIGGKLPGPIGMVAKYGVTKGIQAIENAKTQKRLEEALK